MREQQLGCRPVVIIGAGRSGTNILRDVLTSLDGFGSWPCDEINYIWRHGNVFFPSDELSADLATDRIRRYIRSSFQEIARRYALDSVVEKTCANSLRVPFVEAILPEAKYIYIVRDVRDVVASAAQRWTAPLDISYILRKARWVPRTDLPIYALRYGVNRLKKLLNDERRLSFWGPRFDGIDAALQTRSLPEVCALQWKRCVDAADSAFSTLDPSRVLHISYEGFASDPDRELGRILTFLGVDSPANTGGLAMMVSPSSIGKFRKSLDPATVSSIELLAGDTMRRHGYI